jgi:hypothetical protein
MRRVEAVALLAVAVLMLAAGLTWRFGAWGLIGAGAALTVAVLVVFDIKEG